MLFRDNASYYDFDGVFSTWLDPASVVATYDIFGYYYADFHAIDIHYFFDKKYQSFSILREHGISLLLIKGGDIVWFCQRLSLRNCPESSVLLLATYPSDAKKFNLYKIR